MSKLTRLLLSFLAAVLLCAAAPQTAVAATPITVCVNGQYLNFSVAPREENGRVLVPMRSVFEALGATVDWDGSKQKITASKGDTTIILSIGNPAATVNDVTQILDVPAKLVNSTTLVPLRFVSQALGYTVDWEEATLTVYIGDRPVALPYKVYQKTINNKAVQVVEISPGTMTAGVYIANNRIGSHQDMNEMIAACGAKVAINGTFFNAYSTDGFYEPSGTIIQQGQVQYIGTVGTTLGITAAGKLLMDPLTIKIEGGVNGSWKWPNNWYAYGINRRPGQDGAYLYTRAWGETLGMSRGVAVAVKDGTVSKVVKDSDIAIPAEGFVLNFTGSEVAQLGGRFHVGDTVEYRINFSQTSFAGAVTALGVGPRLVKDGQSVYDPVSEGFSSPKILENSAARSAIGFQSDGTIFLVTTTATVKELSVIMRSLGCNQAMNLDGGASSGLYAQGRMLTRPGRYLSNILYFK